MDRGLTKLYLNCQIRHKSYYLILLDSLLLTDCTSILTTGPTFLPTPDPAQCLHKCIYAYEKEKHYCEGLQFQDRHFCIVTAKNRKKECVYEGYARCKNDYKTDSLNCLDLPILQGKHYYYNIYICKIKAIKKRSKCIKEFKFSNCDKKYE